MTGVDMTNKTFVKKSVSYDDVFESNRDNLKWTCNQIFFKVYYEIITIRKLINIKDVASGEIIRLVMMNKKQSASPDACV